MLRELADLTVTDIKHASARTGPASQGELLPSDGDRKTPQEPNPGPASREHAPAAYVGGRPDGQGEFIGAQPYGQATARSV